jgi:hypothetical protein
MFISQPHGSQLVLERARASRSSGTWKDEDYDVLADGKVVGRILEEGSRFGPPELRWGWSITAIVPAMPGVTNGTAATREEAMAKFRVTWTKSNGGAMAALQRRREQPMSANASAIASNRT